MSHRLDCLCLRLSGILLDEVVAGHIRRVLVERRSQTQAEILLDLHVWLDLDTVVVAARGYADLKRLHCDLWMDGTSEIEWEAELTNLIFGFKTSFHVEILCTFMLFSILTLGCRSRIERFQQFLF